MKYTTMADQTHVKDKEQVRVRVYHRRKKPKRYYVLLGILLTSVLLGTILTVVGFIVYDTRFHSDQLLAQVGIQHLKKAEVFLAGYSKNVLDSYPVNEARREFAAATPIFIHLENDMQLVPASGSSFPIYGNRLYAAQHLLPVAVEVSQNGLVACDTLNLLISHLHNPINGQELSKTDIAAIQQNAQKIGAAFNQIADQLKQVQPSQLAFDPHLVTLLHTFQQELPTLRAWFTLVENVIPVMPALLGIGTSANYLIEVLDSTELRPGGGFIGNYGIATLSGARLTTANIRDSYLLDKPFVDSGHKISYPKAYSWFTLSPASWSFRDSNLDADFPVAAQYSEQNYIQEGGRVPVQGVIAITPALIQHALQITGPISIPEYQETVTAQNLIDRIHYYQLGRVDEEKGLVLAPDGQSSDRKHFTALLAEYFLARVRQLPSSDTSKFVQLLIDAMHTKDIQVYFNQDEAESLLHQLHLDGAIQQPDHDNIFVVDANISGNKANNFITDSMNDHVFIAADGTVTHRTTITYAWTTKGLYYGSSLYQDFTRVYVPSGSVLQAQDGWEQRGVSNVFGHEVWAGSFTLSYGQTRTISFVWKTSKTAMKNTSNWQYVDTVQKQAGTRWNFNLQVTLPSCAKINNMTHGMTNSGKENVLFSHNLSEDTNVTIDYFCK